MYVQEWNLLTLSTGPWQVFNQICDPFSENNVQFQWRIVSLETWRDGGSQKPKFLIESMKLYRTFQLKHL